MCQGNRFSDFWNDSMLKLLSDQIIQCFTWSKNEFSQNWKSLGEHLFSYSLVTIYFRFILHFQPCVGTLHICRMTSGMELWDLNFNRMSVKLKWNTSSWSKPVDSHLGVSWRLCSNPRFYPVRVVTSMMKTASILKPPWDDASEGGGVGVHVITHGICGTLTLMWPFECTFQFSILLYITPFQLSMIESNKISSI